MRTLVAGRFRFVGSAVVNRLAGHGHQVTVVDDLSTGRRGEPGRRAGLRAGRARRGRPCRARAGRGGRRGPTPRSSTTWPPRSTSAAASATRAATTPGSTCSGPSRWPRPPSPPAAGGWSSPARGGRCTASPTRRPCRSTSATRPGSPTPTGCPGRSAEDYLAGSRRLHGLEPVSLRLGNVYGPRQDPHGEAGVVADLLQPADGRRAGDDLRRRPPDPRLRVRGGRGRRVHGRGRAPDAPVTGQHGRPGSSRRCWSCTTPCGGSPGSAPTPSSPRRGRAELGPDRAGLVRGPAGPRLVPEGRPGRRAGPHLGLGVPGGQRRERRRVSGGVRGTPGGVPRCVPWSGWRWPGGWPP